MRTVTVQAPDGSAWRVRVVWEPRWHALARRYGGWRRKDRREGGGDLPDLTGIETPGGGRHAGGGLDTGDDLLVGVVVIIGLVVFGLLFWWLLLPLLLVALDVVVVVVLVVAGVLGRVLFRRPWIVQATGDPGTTGVTAAVVGWRSALQTRDEMADRLRTGRPPVEVHGAGDVSFGGYRSVDGRRGPG